jgi:acetate kinase
MVKVMTNVFVCNAGSTSLKFSLFEAERERLLADGSVDWSCDPARLTMQRQGQARCVKMLTLHNHTDAIARVVDELSSDGPTAPVHAVGHRVVHGGDRYTAAVLITPDVKRAIGELSSLAPLHNPASLEGIHAMERALPGIPHVAAFDTAFHATLSETVRTYPVPRHWTRNWGIRRFGFHGLSHMYCSNRAAEMLGRQDARLVIMHLGGGASVSAVRNGVCVDTSMGFTPVDGLMMGTRSGSVDPGMLIYVQRTKGLDVERLDHAINYESGLLGVSGISADMREVLEAAPRDPDARLAVDIYVHRVRQTVGAMIATLGGIDALIFTGGVGENSAEIRNRVCTNLGELGVKIDLVANTECRPDADIARFDSRARLLVVATREALTIVRETIRVLGAATPAPLATCPPESGAKAAQPPSRSTL